MPSMVVICGAILDLLHLGDAGTDHFAVHDDRAGAALGRAAAHFGAGQPELSAKHVRKRGFRVYDNRLVISR